MIFQQFCCSQRKDTQSWSHSASGPLHSLFVPVGLLFNCHSHLSPFEMLLLLMNAVENQNPKECCEATFAPEVVLSSW